VCNRVVRIQFLCCLFIFCSSSEVLASGCETPVYLEAQELRVVDISNTNQQCFYAVKAKMKSERIFDYYLKYFENEGWGHCQKSGVGWQKFIDQTNGGEKIYQKISYWIKKDNDKLRFIVLGLKHLGSKEGWQQVMISDFIAGADFQIESIGGSCPSGFVVSGSSKNAIQNWGK